MTKINALIVIIASSLLPLSPESRKEKNTLMIVGTQRPIPRTRILTGLSHLVVFQQSTGEHLLVTRKLSPFNPQLLVHLKTPYVLFHCIYVLRDRVSKGEIAGTLAGVGAEWGVGLSLPPL